MTPPAARPPLRLLLAAPRGFCAGVDRAVKIVEEALTRFGAPVYVRHEIVHNRHVVDGLRARGAVFVEELSEVPDDGRPVIFSAHGVAKGVVTEAMRRRLFTLDATCPLVTKVHREAERHHARGRHLLLIGHAGHPEVVGTMGQLPEGAVTLVQDVAEARRVTPPAGAELAWSSQTTLSVDDTAEIVAALTERFPGIAGPAKDDICYATSNRQAAAKALVAQGAEAVIVVGARNSSNSRRLAEVAERAGARRAMLVEGPAALDLDSLQGCATIGLTAGASAPEALVQAVIAALGARFALAVEEVRVAEETIAFRLPPELARPAARDTLAAD
ncbi:4-hydroxy-3-methylbut-2-enyl diphosphate reductase [Falsiroseomonas bella]|uniref:4-hydroxy-3-methylbut-2-enyl diphosphate reductase n=1 Tax=Falsiroseomonas bella TaxID=2184016 RepID=A0A317FL98_9PROT|nr:4-hydroxy-3-methylbut-2-enyl diphosphate reductase [Falsiroseomonas bella]PWS39142.1 4-hydroxy-3-methylbut-2-enyl diphosphate reductase [Falsiroseomonas bella]